MKFGQHFHENIYVGDSFIEKTSDGEILVFFGNKHGTSDLLKEAFPKFQFSKVKQVHGKTCVTSDPNRLIEADAHWTQKKNEALIIVTADCLPILISNASEGKVMGIHAGWRGVNLELLPESLKVFSNKKNCRIYVGPHILKESFEVGTDVITAMKRFDNHFREHADPEKKYIDLLAITKEQATTAGILSQNIFTLNKNTLNDPELASYRRDKPNAGRNISFICRL